MVMDAMSGMITQVRSPRRDERGVAGVRTSGPCRSAIRATCERNVTREAPTHAYVTIVIVSRSAAD